MHQNQNWFAKFRFGNFDVEDASRYGRLFDSDKDTIKALVDANRPITTRETGERPGFNLEARYMGSPSSHGEKFGGILEELFCFEHLPGNTTINSEGCCHQLDKLNDALQQKRPELINRKGVVFHQGNAKAHTSLVARQKLLQLEWDTLSYSRYSPDLPRSDYYLFRSLQNFLVGRTFTSNEDILPAETKNFMSVESCYN